MFSSTWLLLLKISFFRVYVHCSIYKCYASFFNVFEIIFYDISHFFLLPPSPSNSLKYPSLLSFNFRISFFIVIACIYIYINVFCVNHLTTHSCTLTWAGAPFPSPALLSPFCVELMCY